MTFNGYHNFLDELEKANEHTSRLVTMAISSWLTAGAVLLSVLPELFGVLATAQQYAWAWALAVSTVSVVGIGVAMRKVDKDDWRTWLWFSPYVAQLFMSLAVIKLNGGGVELFGPLFSLVGAIYAAAGVGEAQEMRKAAKVDEREDVLFDLEVEERRMKLDEKKAKSDVRVAAYEQKHGVSAADSGIVTPDSRSGNAVITEEKTLEGQEKARAAKASKLAKEIDNAYVKIVSNHAGEYVSDLTWAELGRTIGKNPKTAKAYMRALQESGRINGVVPSDAS